MTSVRGFRGEFSVEMVPEHGRKEHAHTGQVRRGEECVPGRGKRRSKDGDITQLSSTVFPEQSEW